MHHTYTARTGCFFFLRGGGGGGGGDRLHLKAFLHLSFPIHTRAHTHILTHIPVHTYMHTYIYVQHMRVPIVQVYLWDTGGIERYHEPLSSNYYRQCDAIILVYMRGDQQSLVALGEWVNDAKTYSHMKDSVMFSLWENSIDENAPSLGQLEKTFMEHSGIPSSLYFKVSAKTGFNLKEAFESVVTALDKRSVSGLSQSEEHHYVDLKTLHNQPDSESNSSHHTFCRC